MTPKFDRDKLNEKCHEHNIEFMELRNRNHIIFMCPRLPEKDIVAELLRFTPTSSQCSFVESMKRSTATSIQSLLRSVQFMGVFESREDKRSLLVQSEQTLREDHPFWEMFPKLLEKDGFFTSWEISFQNKTIKYPPIKKAQKGNRDHRPTKDEILDLGITLNKTDDFDAIFKDLFGEVN